jgi:hypothetical protein
MKVDKDRGIRYETMTLDEFNERNKTNVPGLETVQFTGASTVTVYNVAAVPIQRYCKDHSGIVVDEDGVFSYIEECDCN